MSPKRVVCVAVAVFVAVAVAYPAFGNAKKDANPAVNFATLGTTIDKLGEYTEMSLLDAPLNDVIQYLGKYHKVRIDPGNQTVPNTRIAYQKTAEFAVVLHECLAQGNWSFAIKPNGEILIYPTPKAKQP